MARNVNLEHLRGVLANIPVLNSGELYYATDTQQLLVGPTPTLVGGAVVAKIDLTAQNAGQTGATLLAATVAKGGMYRVSGYIKKTTAAQTSSTLGPMTVSYTDGTDNTNNTYTMAFTNSAGAIVTTNAVNSATVTGVMDLVPFTFFGKAGAATLYTLTYASSGAISLLYEIHLRVEAL